MDLYYIILLAFTVFATSGKIASPKEYIEKKKGLKAALKGYDEIADEQEKNAVAAMVIGRWLQFAVFVALYTVGFTTGQWPLFLMVFLSMFAIGESHVRLWIVNVIELATVVFIFINHYHLHIDITKAIFG